MSLIPSTDHSFTPPLAPTNSTFVVALFDVLGFSHRMKRYGLEVIASRYEKLKGLADAHNTHVEEIYNTLGVKETAYWTAGGKIAAFQKVECAYASDSLLIWAHAAFPDARGMKPEECAKLAEDHKNGWSYFPPPCDSFLDLCNEFICHGIEIGLPLRGAISMGTCILDSASGVYLGMPLIENAELEKSQEFVGAGFCSSFLTQTVPPRFKLAYTGHLKPDQSTAFGGCVLDWPRHWRRTRQGTLTPKILRLARGAKDKRTYYEKTLHFIAVSDAAKDQHESEAETNIRMVYPQFSHPEVACRVRAVRKAKAMEGA